MSRLTNEGRISTVPTPYRVHCWTHGAIYLTEREYTRQMWNADSLWKCPDCGGSATWDDNNYEDRMEHS
ncbi:MAG TPA: hypothetical protein VM487_05075 [Phycisphaerae bacterium]|nr:hypothetical protein [Phycisphaerae bacterium]